MDRLEWWLPSGEQFHAMGDARDDTPSPEGLEQIGHGTSFREGLCDMLERIQLLRELNGQEIEALADFVQAYRARPGTILFQEGQRDPYMCLVVEGKLDVLKERGEHERRRLATVRAGKTVGEMSLIDELPHSATVVTTTDTTLLLLTRLGLERLAEAHPRLAFHITWKLAQLLSHRLRQTSGILVDYL